MYKHNLNLMYGENEKVSCITTLRILNFLRGGIFLFHSGLWSVVFSSGRGLLDDVEEKFCDEPEKWV